MEDKMLKLNGRNRIRLYKAAYVISSIASCILGAWVFANTLPTILNFDNPMDIQLLIWVSYFVTGTLMFFLIIKTIRFYWESGILWAVGFLISPLYLLIALITMDYRGYFGKGHIEWWRVKVVFTWDDAYMDLYHHGMKAVVLLTVVENKKYLNILSTDTDFSRSIAALFNGTLELGLEYQLKNLALPEYLECNRILLEGSDPAKIVGEIQLNLCS